mgnify:CR=1 FL=1
MLFNKKFDLIFSLGEDCACTSYLRRFHLQEYSYPFDWLTNADFFTRIDLLINDFKGFLEKENLTIIAYSYQKAINKHTDDYKDTKTDFYFYHDFDTKMPFDESFALVKVKYQRRIERLYQQIQDSQNILIVWWSRDKHQDIDKVKESYALLSQKFATKNISMLLIESGKESQQFYPLNANGGGGLMLLQYDNTSFKHNPNYTETMGNEANNNAVFAKIKRKKKCKDYVKLVIFHTLKLLINLIPLKKARHSLRNKWRFYLFRDKL